MFLRALLPSSLIAITILVYFVSANTSLFGKPVAPEVLKEPAEIASEGRQVIAATLDVSTQSFAQQLELSGITKANMTASVRAQLGGEIAQILVTRGQYVQAGDILARIKEGSVNLRVEQALVQLQRAENDYQAQQKLAEQGFSSESLLDNSKLSFNAAQSAYKDALLAQDNLDIKASIDGVLQSVDIELGDFISAGQSVAQIINVDVIKVQATVNQKAIAKLKPGMNADITFASGQKLTAQLSFISLAALGETRTFEVEFSLDNPNRALVEGMSASIKIDLPEQQAHYVPTSSLTLSDKQILGIKAVENSRVAFYPVTLLQTDQFGVWVTGLPQTSAIIVKGQEFVSQGQKIEHQPLSLQEKLRLEDYFNAIDR